MPEDDTISVTCYECEHPIHKRDNFYEHGGHKYCQECYFENFGACTGCDEVLGLDELTSGSDGEGFYCSDCFQDQFFHCEECGEAAERTDDHVFNDKYLCPTCMEKAQDEHRNSPASLEGEFFGRTCQT